MIMMFKYNVTKLNRRLKLFFENKLKDIHYKASDNNNL